MIIKWSLHFILGTSSVTMNLMFRKWGQYWLSSAARIDHASNQNYSNLSVLMTVFQALRPLSHFTVVPYMTCPWETFVRPLILSARCFCLLSSICWFDHAIRIELPHSEGRPGRLWWPRSQRSASSFILGHHWISYLERIPVCLVA